MRFEKLEFAEGEGSGAYAGADDRAALDCAGEDVVCEDEVVVGLVFCVGRVWPEARHDEGVDCGCSGDV